MAIDKLEIKRVAFREKIRIGLINIFSDLGDVKSIRTEESGFSASFRDHEYTILLEYSIATKDQNGN
jgi:urate oxidase